MQYFRAEVLEQLDIERRTPESAPARRRAHKPFTALAHHWSKVLLPSTDGQDPDHIFADCYTQTIAFALLLARTEGLRLTGRDLAAVASELEVENTVMGQPCNC
ncbi:hypothetical protein [Streptomyces sp. NPDC005407]|uniref:hypothetical protein n=1 Tax=Streptomyces sp. NPDC005407 TaxID=3155340 RepID=UPI0033AFE039